MGNGKIIIFLLKFFIISALFIISNQHLALTEPASREVFFDRYTSWLSNTFDNTYLLVGDAVKLEWLPESNNSTSLNK